MRLPKYYAFGWIMMMLAGQTFGQSQQPVTKNATPEAVELLQFIYSISGKKTLSGQHDYPMSGSYFTSFVREITGDYPVVYGRDLGFSADDTLDGINYRQRTVDEAIENHRKGAIITFMWHAVPPTMDEPVTFREGIQSKLTDKQWVELITPGTVLNKRWQEQVDVIASYLKQLQEAKVPVIWRPYHEMNGNWFWWGDRPGENGYRRLYRMLFERLVEHHNLRNLIWVFNGNEMRFTVSSYEPFYPGDDVVDILATDVYKKYKDSDYERLLKLGKGKPIALGEIGPFPTPKYLKAHPRWVWFMCWTDFLIRQDRDKVNAIYSLPQVLTRGDLETTQTD